MIIDTKQDADALPPPYPPSVASSDPYRHPYNRSASGQSYPPTGPSQPSAVYQNGHLHPTPHRSPTSPGPVSPSSVSSMDTGSYFPMSGARSGQGGGVVTPPHAHQQPRQFSPHQQSYPAPPPPPLTAAQVGAAYQQELFARCAVGNHDFETKYGVAGIICAVICFPFGLAALLVDQEKKCRICHASLESLSKHPLSPTPRGNAVTASSVP